MADLVIAVRYINASEAFVARSVLQSEGIFALVPEEHTGAAMPHIIMGDGGYRLLVREQDLERVLAILRDAQLSAE